MDASLAQSTFDPYVPPTFGNDHEQTEWLRRWNDWVSQPIKPYLVVRIMSGFYVRQDLPSGIETEDDIRRCASSVAKRLNRKLCLVMSRRTSMWYLEDGTCEKITEAQPGVPNVPTMRFSGSDRNVTFHQQGRGLTLVDVDQLAGQRPESVATDQT